MEIQHNGAAPDRVDFSKISTSIPIPNLIEVQKNSYERFLQMDLLPNEREDIGLQTGAARRIGRGEREHDRGKRGIVVGGHDDATPECVAQGGRLLHCGFYSMRVGRITARHDRPPATT